MRIDVYDFDGTIYDGDSTVDFVFFCLRRHPNVIAGLPHLVAAAVKIKSRGLSQFRSVLFGEMLSRPHRRSLSCNMPPSSWALKR